ncbi:TPA: non-canonical purine NTP pyrophosphatase [Legionella pneumophila subsp. pneumophila]|uniref:non-canonical purine NTP pyrophosphatase n=1 Tax=Legionella sp. PATHC039 TaxID=2992042 RepID=UPI001A206AD0|nr:non-canonical purine NTP pyrophosphatase [Legionella sp. PATHC039]MCW8394104.1 non-canonical purine NTP pyrophosphatase [Legionella sp. PATHC039]HAT8857683.1 non-canonical purine NTP pyrophosphatase [Legionella pneumophila subsp. pneumophila]HAT9651850.1 non-canonical purine NTP pyrophosphatase [Legionella pneumophila subsp. pneumophila]HAT9919246.1 non-canonical purine NTP pyrophosphatase [Legionella pneumophila subsp. pneumophila]
MDSIVFASNNSAKIALVKKVCSVLPIRIKDQGSCGIAEVMEDKETFIENALLKARNACFHTHLPAIADDSGLLVPSLGNRPGVRTNRYAGEGKTKEQAMSKLLTDLQGMAGVQRVAKFICTMVFLNHASDPTPVVLQHELIGEIALQPQGQGVYGFDSIFYLPSYGATFAQLSPEIQEKEDPRNHVLKQLVVHLNNVLKL